MRLKSDYYLKLTIPGLPKPINAIGRKHWSKINSERKVWRNTMVLACKHQRPAKPLEKAKLKLTRHSSKCPDYDGLVNSFKSVVDGLIDAEVLANDTMDVTGVWDCSWQKEKPLRGCITVEVMG